MKADKERESSSEEFPIRCDIMHDGRDDLQDDDEERRYTFEELFAIKLDKKSTPGDVLVFEST